MSEEEICVSDSFLEEETQNVQGCVCTEKSTKCTNLVPFF